jgi:hypothetical protein
MIAPQILVTTPPMVGQTHIKIHIDTKLPVSYVQARRQVTGYLIDSVSDHLGGEQPILVINGEQLWWRVPVVLFLTSLGRVGQVGFIDVDCQTGELLITESRLEGIRSHADYLATRATL